MGAFHNTKTLELSLFDFQRTTEAQPSALIYMGQEFKPDS